MAKLGYKSHNNTAAPKTIIWIFYAGERVSHPQGGVLRLFIHKDAWRVLINKHICCHGHLGVDYCRCSSCTCCSKRNVIVPVSLVLLSTSISYALTLSAHEASTIFQFESVCARVCVRERESDFGRACACQRGNNVNVILRCITPCLIIWFATAVSQTLLLLSQCRAISSVVIAKQMKKRKKIETQVMTSSSFFSVFKCFNISVVAKKK